MKKKVSAAGVSVSLACASGLYEEESSCLSSSREPVVGQRYLIPSVVHRKPVTVVISVRNETPDDYEVIRRVTVEAFASSEQGHNGEAELVDSLRAKSVDRLSLVACLDDEIVGHILFTAVTIRTPQHELSGMGLAPLSVPPKHQHAGIGSALVTDGLGQLFERGCPFVVVLGHPEYYRRFGFLPASHFEISHGFAGLPQEVFFILPRSGGSLAKMTRGAVYYHVEFGPQHSSE